MDDRDALGGKAAGDEIVARRLRDDLEVAAAVDVPHRQLERVHGGGQEWVHLAEDRRAHEVRDDGEDRGAGEERAVEGNLVDVVEDDVGRLPGREAAEEKGDGEIEGVRPAAPDDAIAVGLLDGGRAREARADQRAAVPAAPQVVEDLLEMHLRAARERIPQVSPVERDDVQARPRG